MVPRGCRSRLLRTASSKAHEMPRRDGDLPRGPSARSPACKRCRRAGHSRVCPRPRRPDVPSLSLVDAKAGARYAKSLRQLTIAKYGSCFSGSCETCAAGCSRASGGELAHRDTCSPHSKSRIRTNVARRGLAGSPGQRLVQRRPVADGAEAPQHPAVTGCQPAVFTSAPGLHTAAAWASAFGGIGMRITRGTRTTQHPG